MRRIFLIFLFLIFFDKLLKFLKNMKGVILRFLFASILMMTLVNYAQITKTTVGRKKTPTNKMSGFPIMTFNSKYTNFGKVKTGDMPAITYDFVNTGNTPMDIGICSGCECTEIDWTKTTIMPGEKGFVKAVFNTVKAEKDDHKKQLTKYIDIVLKQTHPSNGYPIVETVKFDVFIID